ncbi:MAG: hypothetical protein IJS56_05125 [Bacilli bacterium]|nr:hypothetical protein [Bacilli bacterium]
MFKKRHKVYLKLNLVSIVFAVVSFISVSFAWFAYSGLVDVKTEVGVKAWYIEFEKNNEVVSNDIVISLSDLYPGMEPLSEVITIKNLGDSDAKLKYSIDYARILDDDKDYYTLSDDYTSERIEDALSHNYPFSINAALSKTRINAKDSDAEFIVTVSWPLDSGNDMLDSTWGSKAYQFEKKQDEKKKKDSSYNKEPSIKIGIDVSAQQITDDVDDLDYDFEFGKVVLFDVKNNMICSSLSENCLKTYVIDDANLIGDKNVSLLPDISSLNVEGNFNNYKSIFDERVSSWNVKTRELEAKDILKVVSKDINSSLIVTPNISDAILGTVKYGTRAETMLTKVGSTNGYISYDNKFKLFNTIQCVWTSTKYNNEKGYAYSLDDNKSKLYGESNNTTCNIIPVIVAPKSNIISD